MNYTALLLLALFAVAAAFVPTRFGARTGVTCAAGPEEIVSSMTGKEKCMQKELDKNGRCPGEAGYVSFAKAAPADFAAFKAEMAAKKAAAAAKKQ